ncbi:Hamartin protein-domain-containing protein [Apiosordaria backusii]|uniref:Hamartin protein-domain-containing protein n=1 Tax=Apiosordaria backusii TaxID=314023 RepID=A0AA40EER6_9PEZI|nr:Hamartin protein-domain-containing protein [Apiosordaria backusii]
MTSSGSSKDLVKGLTGFLQSPSLPLPSEVNVTISSYLEKHEKSEESAGEKLDEELSVIWEKIVRDRPERYAAFLAIIRELRPVLRTPTRIFKWWDKLLDPALEHVGSERGLAREVLEHTLDLLSTDEHDPDAWNSGQMLPLASRLLARWLEIVQTEGNFGPAAQLKERMIKDALVAFGKRDPKGFMTVLNDFVMRKDDRNVALSLLQYFVSSGPPHLHVILQTPLFQSILQSLQRDESTNTVAIALVALNMILPFIPSSLVTYLPTLFNIYARLLFWDRDSLYTQQNTEMGQGKDGPWATMPWDKVLMDPDFDGSRIPHLQTYFTLLYGLYPINFLDYIRKPHRYLRHANNAEDIDVQATEIRDRSERFRKQHILHPNFYNLTIESEKTDLSRWISSEADEVQANCMSLKIEPGPLPLNIAADASLPGVPASVLSEGPDQDSREFALLSSPVVDSSRQSMTIPSLALDRPGSQLSHSTPSGYNTPEPRSRGGGDSPTLPPQLAPSASHSRLQDLIHSNKVIKSGLHPSLNSDSVPSLVLSPQEQPGEKSPFLPPTTQISQQQGRASVDLAEQAALLHHERLLLLNDLQYERFIKQQHMMHMGELRRKQVREAATEAETQNLVMANRSLKQHLDEAKRNEAQIKKEFDNRRNISKKWEDSLSNKLKILRDEQKQWVLEETELRQQLEKARGEIESLRRIVDEAEKKRLESEQNLEAVDISTAMIEKLKAEIVRLSATEHLFHGKEIKMQTAIQEAAAAEARAEQLSKELAAREEQLQRERRHYQTEIDGLKSELGKALQNKQQTSSKEVMAAYEGALAAARAKNTDLQKQYAALMRKYTVLKSSLLDMQCDAMEKGGKPIEIPTSVADGRGDQGLGSPIVGRLRSPRVPSDSVGFEGSHNATPPLEPLSSSLGSVLPPNRPSTPPGRDASGSEKTSPQAERYFGRGGVQNTKKDKKEKKEEKAEKKEKKLGTGIRGIRGFV